MLLNYSFTNEYKIIFNVMIMCKYGYVTEEQLLLYGLKLNEIFIILKFETLRAHIINVSK